MRNAGRIKLGYYPLPVEEAKNIRTLLVPSAPYAEVDSCVGDGGALVEITKGTGAHLAGIELDANRATAAAQKGITTVHGSAFECRVLAETCSLLISESALRLRVRPPVCHTVFRPPSLHKMKYCSYRCAHRIAMHNYRQRRSGLKKSTGKL